MKKLLKYILSIGFILSANAQTVRKYSNEFLNIGVNAAALGMSNSVVAHSDDVYATYWNPSGLLNLKDKQVGVMHASYFANIAQYDYAGFAMPIDENSAWGISLIRFGVDDILNTTQLIDSQGNIDYNRISLFSTADYAFNFSYARNNLIKGVKLGANAKIIRRIIGDFANSWGFGFDIAAQYETNKKWKFGLMARDITTTYNTWSIDEVEFEKIKNAVPGENQELPETTEITLPKLQLGVAKQFELSPNYGLLSSFQINTQFAQTNDLISSSTVSLDPALGFELNYQKMIFLRTGVGNFQEITQIDNTTKVGFQPNIGLGFAYKGIQIDYALTDIGNQSAALYSNVFSVKVDFSIFK